MFILGYAENETQTHNLAEHLGISYAIVTVHHFPDGESKVIVPVDNLTPELIIFRSLNNPNDKLVELLLTCSTARKYGVKNMTLVAPYLCYMRQDKEFINGEAVSQRIIGKFFSELFDKVITVDPHLHRISHLYDAIPIKHACSVSSAPCMGKFLRSQLTNPILVGPDIESEQWVAKIAKLANLNYIIAEKQRYGDSSVSIQIPNSDLKGKDVVLIDDMASTAQTLIQTTKKVIDMGVHSVHCLVTHAIFCDNGFEKLKKAGVTNIWSTDSITHSSNVIPLGEILVKALISSTD